MSDNFWNDKLVVECFVKLFNSPYNSMSWGEVLSDFKKEKLNNNKDWEIVDYRYILEGNEKQVISVRRSDDEVFSVGDNARHRELSYGVIEKFTVDPNNMMWVWINKTGHVLSSIEKAKQKLFTTEDGKDVYEGDEVWWINVSYESYWAINSMKADIGCVGYHTGEKYFSTEQAAKEYIFHKKPSLCFDDVVSCVIPTNKPLWKFIDEEKLKKLVKQKINL